jgi:hypothetical protein
MLRILFSTGLIFFVQFVFGQTIRPAVESKLRVAPVGRDYVQVVINGANFNDRGSCVPSPYDETDPIYQQVIALDPFCCDTEWDGICQDAYNSLSNPPSCVPSPYNESDPIYQQVIAATPSCCDVEWDGVCQDAYNALNSGPTPCVPSPYAPDNPVYLQVIAQDPYCCDVAWDGLCQEQYDELAGPDPSNCVPSPYPTNDPYYLQVIAADPLCCFVQWSNNCQLAYELLTGPPACVPSPYAEDDPYYISVITANPACCDVAWNETCQNAYNLAIGLSLPDFNAASFALYPNPSSGFVSVVVDDQILMRQIKIYGASGVLVYASELSLLDNKTDLDLNHLSAGVYHLVVFDRDTRLIQKLVITK